MKAYFSGGPLDAQYRDMERTPMEWRVPIMPPVPCCTLEAYRADPNVAVPTWPVKHAVYKRSARDVGGTVVYWYQDTR